MTLTTGNATFWLVLFWHSIAKLNLLSSKSLILVVFQPSSGVLGGPPGMLRDFSQIRLQVTDILRHLLVGGLAVVQTSHPQANALHGKTRGNLGCTLLDDLVDMTSQSCWWSETYFASTVRAFYHAIILWVVLILSSWVLCPWFE